MRSMVRSGLGALGAFLCLTVVSTAGAQPAPPTAPPGAGPGAPAQPGTSGAAPSAGPTQDGAMQGNNAATANDAGSKEGPRKAPARVPWRGTNVSMSYSTSAQSLGIGKDYIGTDEQTQSFGTTLLLNYFLKEKGKLKIRTSTSIGFDVELSDGDTTTKHEPQFRDVPVSLIASMPIARSADKEWSLSGTVNGTVILPTSPASQNNGMYFTASPRVLLGAGFPVLGPKAPVLKSLFVGVSSRLDHRFTKANVPVNEDLNRPRTSATGSTFLSDQLTGGAVTRNSVRATGFLFFDEQILNRPFWLFVAGGWVFNFRDELTAGGTIPIQNGNAVLTNTPDKRTATNATLFNVGITYFPMVEWGVGMDYTNSTSQLGPDGTRRNFFYSPSAEFSASVIISVDAIYERLTGPEREEPVIYFGKGKSAPAKLQSQF